MTEKTFRYHFKKIDKCNMCGSDVSTHKILGKRLNSSQGKNPKRKTGITTSVVKCNQCELIYSNPQPIPFDIQDHYGVAPENYWKPEYFLIKPEYFQGEIERLKKMKAIEPGMKSLDIGAGLGKAMISLKNAGFDAYGFEPSEQFFQRAIDKMGIESDKLKLGMIENIDYPENEFDFITFGAVLEHLYDPAFCIEKAMKWLKPKGIIHIEVPSSKWLTNKIINRYYKLRGSDYVANISPMHEPFHLYEFSPKSFIAHSKVNGYKVIKSEIYVCDTYLPKILDPLIKFYMKKTDSGMQLCVWLQKNDSAE